MGNQILARPGPSPSVVSLSSLELQELPVRCRTLRGMSPGWRPCFRDSFSAILRYYPTHNTNQHCRGCRTKGGAASYALASLRMACCPNGTSSPLIAADGALM